MEEQQLNKAWQDGAVTAQNDAAKEIDPSNYNAIAPTLVKNCSIPNVRQQSELLNAFLEWRLTKPYSDFQTREHDINQFLEAFNCA